MCGTVVRCLACTVLLLTIIPNSHAQYYNLTDLGTLPGDTDSLAWGMNSSAMVVGASEGAGSGGIHGFFWSTTGGMLDLGCGQSFAGAINDTSHVVGSCGPASDTETAFIWTQDTGLQNLGALPNGTFSGANAINNANQVVGTSNYGTDPSDLHAFLWTANTGMTDLGTLPGGTFSLGNGINMAGQVVGYSGYDSASGYHAFVWTASSGMVDLGTLSKGVYSDAAAINDYGIIVGDSDSGSSKGNLRAVYWKKGNIHNLGLLNGANYSFAAAINDLGDIVGESGPKHKDASHAVIWKNGTIHDLNNKVCGTTGFILTSARAINVSGQIAGYGMINGNMHAFLATPTQTCPKD